MCSRDQVDVFDFGRVEKKKRGHTGGCIPYDLISFMTV